MKLVENSEVSTIIVKDMSRLGREYLQVGQYTELVFPGYGIRFIAINDNVDSLYGDNDFTPFKNLFNDFYAKDTSRKIRAAKKTQAERGERVGTRAPYGYKKDEEDPKKKMVPDEDAAPVIQKIFNLYAWGKGPSQISRQLKDEEILTPGNYYYHKTGVLLTGVDTTRPYDWSSRTIADILRNEVYLGHTVNLQSTTVSYKNKKRMKRPKSEQLRFENTHEPLMDKKIWGIVQDIRKHKRRRANMEEQNMFSRLVYCADCGGTMVLHRAHTMDAAKNHFMCSTYKKHGKEVCTAHYIREKQLAEIILDDLRRVTHFARQQETLFVQHINQRNNVLGRIINEQFRMLSADYNDEQNNLKRKILQAVERMKKLQDSISNVSRFVEKAKRYTDIPELTGEFLHLFIESIDVGEHSERYSRTAEQKIIIRYRDIGILGAFTEEVQKIAV